jgi:signal transduction histidine kinase
MPQGKRIKIRSRDVAKAAREVGALNQHVAELATELRRARENTNGGKRRSPVEVVLNGLTARH